MKLTSKISFLLAGLVMAFFLFVKVNVLTENWSSTPWTRTTEFICFLSLIPLFYVVVKDFLEKSKYISESKRYIEKLNNALVYQSHSEMIYTGNDEGVSRSITHQITEILDADRASVWLYNKERNAITCFQLYVRAEGAFYNGTELFEKDFLPYFEALRTGDYIAADDAEAHPATSCFTEVYLKPLGIKSMLDVPIWHRGSCMGVICIENLTKRKWKSEEIAFSQLQAALFSFSYAMRENNELTSQLKEFNSFVDTAALVSMADEKGKITYVNRKFTDVSGYSLSEVVGKDHNIVNSGEHPKEFWKNMYKVTLRDRKIWNDVCTNRNKNGELYYVDTYIKAIFEKGEHKGFMSIRQDVTDIVKAGKEIEKKNTYLEHAAKILRHDMHSGINTYIPRGLSSLERRISEEQAKELKIDAPIRMIKEGLRHTQKVYRGVYEFTNLVKKDVILNREDCDLNKILEDYLSATAYRPQVILESLGVLSVNEALFCTAIDNMIRNGLKYNDSLKKEVKIRREGDFLYVEDNGRGMSSEDFKTLSKPYTRKEGQKESGTGLGLNICIAILEEHGFSIQCDKLPQGGTQMKIKIS